MCVPNHLTTKLDNKIVFTCRYRFKLNCAENHRTQYISDIIKIMRIKNDLEFQIGRYQSRATCFDIILTEALAEVWMSKHVARD